jgi:hypothetical protein
MFKLASKIGLVIAIVSFANVCSYPTYAIDNCSCVIRTNVSGMDKPVDDKLGKSEQNSQETCTSNCQEHWALQDDAASIKGDYEDTSHTCACAIQTTLLTAEPSSNERIAIPNTYPFHDVEGRVNSKEECTQACANYRIPHNTASIVGIYTPHN